MALRILTGDCRDVLPTLPADSFDCIVTSPPYWGLRDYGTATWEGGDADCAHSVGGQVAQTKAPGAITSGVRPGVDASRCRLCGARRVDAQIGLEPTLDAYIETIRGVARELWRVLKPEGTFWLNLGSCYTTSGGLTPGKRTPGIGQASADDGLMRLPRAAARGSGSNPSRRSSRAQACGNDGKAPLDSTGLGSACFGPDDEHQGDSLTHRGRTPGTSRPLGQSLPPGATTDPRSGHLDAGQWASSSFHLPTSLSSLRNALGAAYREATVSASPSPQTFACDDPSSAHRAVYIPGIEGSASASRTSGKDASETAFDDPSEAFSRYLATMARHFKAKDLVDVPHLVALALQADGWWLRSAIVWHKPNPMPESVTDRPTSAYEMLFLLTKAERYFYDAAAIAEDATNRETFWRAERYIEGSGRNDGGAHNAEPCKQRNARNVWTIATQPYSGSHFATMPPALAERCIKAGSSEKGVCPHCGRAWERQVEKTLVPGPKAAKSFIIDARDINADPNDQGSNRQKDGHKPGWRNDVKTLGWSPSCCCPAHDPVPANILDPFGGAGTTGLVADRLGRNATLIELNPAYRDMCAGRISGDAGMFAEIEVR